MPRAEAKYVLTAEDRTGRAFESVKARFATTARTAARVASGIAAAGLAGFGAMARSAINTADEIGKLSRELGISTENLSEMRGVLDLIGGSFDAYTNSIRRMQRSIADFSDGSGEAADAFTKLGISLDQVEGVGTEQAMMRINAALSDVEDVTLRNALAADIYGRNAQTMLRIIDAGAEQVANLRREQEAMGLSLSGETTAAAERFNDAIARMSQVFQGAVLQSIAPELDHIAAGIENLSRGIGPIIGFVTDLVRLLALIPEKAGASAAALAQILQGNFSGAGAIGEAFNQSAAETFRDVFGSGDSEPAQDNRALLETTGRGATASERTATAVESLVRDGIPATAG